MKILPMPLLAVMSFLVLSLPACDEEQTSHPPPPSTNDVQADQRAATSTSLEGALHPVPGTPTPQRTSPTPTPESSITAALVADVIDGDTIQLEDGSQVHYIGIDSPESVLEQECFGQETTDRNRDLVEGKVVELEKDVSETDDGGRLLRYVYVDGMMINAALVLEGLAQVSTSPADLMHQNELQAAQEHAVGVGAGQWSRCPE